MPWDKNTKNPFSCLTYVNSLKNPLSYTSNRFTQYSDEYLQNLHEFTILSTYRTDILTQAITQIAFFSATNILYPGISHGYFLHAQLHVLHSVTSQGNLPNCDAQHTIFSNIIGKSHICKTPNPNTIFSDIICLSTALQNFTRYIHWHHSISPHTIFSNIIGKFPLYDAKIGHKWAIHKKSTSE